MVDFTNFQLYGVPVVTYLLVGITTGVLAYATSIGGIEKVAAKASESLGDITENPASILSKPPSLPIPEKSKEEEPSAPPEENEPSPEIKESNSEELPKSEGGKKRKKHTPKSKAKSKKQKKNTKRSHK